MITEEYDPRGFEFEITVDNLLFILQECSSIKGKGIEGELIYSWDGKDLVLLPCSSEEYKESKDFTSLQTKKVTKNDITLGCLYKNKDGNTVMYLGRENWYEEDFSYSHNVWKLKTTNQHIFLYVDKDDNYLGSGKSRRYWLQKGFTKLAEKLTTEASTDFADEYDKFKKSFNGSAPTEITHKKDITNVVNKLTNEKYANCGYYSDHNSLIVKDGKYYPVFIARHIQRKSCYGTRPDIKEDFFYIWESPNPLEIDGFVIDYNVGYGNKMYYGPGRESGYYNQNNHGVKNPNCRKLTLDEVKELNLVQLYVSNESGGVSQITKRWS